MGHKWLRLGDRFILDDADYRVIETVSAHTDRTTVQALCVMPELGGEARWLLQVEDEDPLEAERAEAQGWEDAEVTVGGERLRREWSAPARTEHTLPDRTTRFGRGECAMYRSAGGVVGVRISDQAQAQAFVGRPLPPERIDLRFT